MATINFNAIDEDKNTSSNSVGTINFDAISQENKDTIQHVIDNPVITAPPAESQNVRSYLQGFLLGFEDEIEAGLRSIVPGSRPYEEIRDEIRQKLQAFQKENPKIAITQEILGALAPTALAFILPGGQALASARTGNLIQRAFPAMKWGAAEGAGVAYGTGEEGFLEDFSRTPIGGAIGTVFGGTAGVLMDAGGNLISKYMNKASQLLGNKASEPAAKILQDFAERLGKSPDQVLQGMLNGEIFADNATLHAIIKSMRSELPPPAIIDGEKANLNQVVDDTLVRRTRERKNAAREEMQSILAPDQGEADNIYKAYNMDRKTYQQQLNKLYDHVYEDAEELTPEIVDKLLETIQKFPNAGEIMQELYKAKGKLVPFFKVYKNGSIKITRMPTLKDAEDIRKQVNEAAQDAWQNNKQNLGGALNETEDELRQLLDNFSPSLRATRQQAHINLKAKDAWDEGKKAFSPSMGVDKLEVVMEQLLGSPTKQNAKVLQAFRHGVMHMIRKFTDKQPTFVVKVATEDSFENKIIRTVFPEESVEQVIKKAKVAGDARTTETQVKFNSITAPTLKGGKVLEKSARAATGDGLAAVNLISDLADELTPGLSDNQKMTLLKLLFSEDPNLVRAALVDSSKLAPLRNLINRFTGGISRGTQSAMSRQGGQAGGDVETGSTGLLSSMMNSGNDKNNEITLWK